MAKKARGFPKITEINIFNLHYGTKKNYLFLNPHIFERYCAAGSRLELRRKCAHTVIGDTLMMQSVFEKGIAHSPPARKV